MAVLNDLDRFHLVNDAIDPLPQPEPKWAYVNQAPRDKLIEHRESIPRYGGNPPEIRNGKSAGGRGIGSGA